MSFTNPIPSQTVLEPREASPLLGMRDSNTPGRLWQNSRDSGRQLLRNTQAIEQLQRQLNRLRATSGSDDSIPVTQFAIKEIFADCLLCNTLAADGILMAGDDTYIAKPARFQRRYTTEVIDGRTINYDYGTIDPDNIRHATSGAQSQWETCYPRYVLYDEVEALNAEYLPGGMIYAAPCYTIGLKVTPAGGTEQDVTWIEISPARVWARRYSQGTPTA